MKIANKISFSFLITALILTGIAAPIFYTTARNNVKNAIFAHLKTTAWSRTRHIETFLEAGKKAIKQLSKSIIIEQFLLVGKKDEDYNRKLNDAMRRLKSTAKVMKYVYEIFVLNEDGIIVASSNESNIGLDKSTDAYFLAGMKETYIKDAYYSKTTGKRTVAISTPILNGETRDLLGVLVARLELTGLNEITTDTTGLGETGKIYLVNKKGYIITPSRFIKNTFLKQKVNTENIRAYFKDSKKYDRKPHDHEPLKYTDYRGVKVLGLHSHIYDMQWCLCAEINEKEALAPLAKIKILFVITMTFVPIAAWLIGIFVSKLISGPIHKLHLGTEVIGKGNLDYKVGTDAKDEIGQLSRAFDKMTNHLKQSTTSIDNLNEQITDRKKAEDALRESEGKMSAMLQSFGDHMSMMDKDLNILWANEVTKGLFGDKVIGKKCYEVYHGRDNPCEPSPCLTLKAFEDGQIHEHETQVKCTNGRILDYACTASVALRDDEGNPTAVIEISRDITKRKQAELKQNELIKKVNHINKELKEFASIVSHDLKAPLRGIKTLANWISSDFADKLGDEANEQMNLLLERVERMYTLIDGALQYS